MFQFPKSQFTMWNIGNYVVGGFRIYKTNIVDFGQIKKELNWSNVNMIEEIMF